MEIKAPSLDPFKSLMFYSQQAMPEQKVVYDLESGESPLKLVPTGKPAKLKLWQAILGYYRIFAGYLGPRHRPDRERHIGVFDALTLGSFYAVESFTGVDLWAGARNRGPVAKFGAVMAFIFVKVPLNLIRAAVSAVLALVCAIPALMILGTVELGKKIQGAYRASKLQKVSEGAYSPIDEISEKAAQVKNKPDLDGIEKHLPQGMSPDKVVWEITKTGKRPHAEYSYNAIPKAQLEQTILSGYTKIVKSIYCVESTLPKNVQAKLTEADNSTDQRPQRKGAPVSDRSVYFKRPKVDRDLGEMQPEETTYLYLR